MHSMYVKAEQQVYSLAEIFQSFKASSQFVILCRFLHDNRLPGCGRYRWWCCRHCITVTPLLLRWYCDGLGFFHIATVVAITPLSFSIVYHIIGNDSFLVTAEWWHVRNAITASDFLEIRVD